MINKLQEYIYSLPGLQLWLDSTRINGDGNPNPTIGDSIAAWKDVSGNNRNFVYIDSPVTTGLTQPKLQSLSFYNNPNPAVEFIASNKTVMSYPAIRDILGTVNTMVFVTKSTDAGSLIDGNYNDLGFAIRGGFIFKDTTFGSSFGNRSFVSGKRFGTDILIVKYKQQTTSTPSNGIFTGIQTSSVKETLDKLPLTVAESDNNVNLMRGVKLTLGAFFVGTNSTYITFGSGFIMEAIVWNRLLTDWEINRVQSYLKTKYII